MMTTINQHVQKESGVRLLLRSGIGKMFIGVSGALPSEVGVVVSGDALVHKTGIVGIDAAILGASAVSLIFFGNMLRNGSKQLGASIP